MPAMTIVLPVSSIGLVCIGLVIGYVIGRATK